LLAPRRKLVNQWAADHTHSVAGAAPIPARDMYEHSYYLGYGAAAAKEVGAFMENNRSDNTSSLAHPLARSRRGGQMRPRISIHMVFLGLVAIVSTSSAARAADPDWKAVEQALGKSGQMQPGEVFRIGMPRTDLSVTVKGVPVKAGFALGSYAAFKPVRGHSMVIA